MTERLDDRAEAIPPATASPSATAPATAIANCQDPHLQPAPRAVAVTALIRDFGSPRVPIRAVDDLDLQVHTGEIYGFLGPNGAGKTTLVRILTTLLRPTAGSALVAGHDVVHEADAVRRSIGVALQEAAIDPLMTGRELLQMQGALHGLRGAEAKDRATSLLDRVGLTDARVAAGSAATRAACGGGSTSRWRSSTIRPCSSSTSPPRASTRRAARHCGARCVA